MGKQDRAAQTEQLERAVRTVLTEEGFARWADCRRRFRSYSWANQFMIASQRPDATRVAGYRAWQELGRQVRKGEHGLRIWAPRTRKNDETGERELVGFVLVPVFDISQTEGDELPEFPGAKLESSDYPDALERLETFTRGELGFELEYAGDLGGAQGVCSIDGKRIAVLESLSTDARLSTLAHEVAHAHGIGYREYGRDRAEVIVEAASTLALRVLGLDTSSYSLAYLAAYSENGGLEALKKDLGAIDKIAGAIERAILPEAS